MCLVLAAALGLSLLQALVPAVTARAAVVPTPKTKTFGAGIDAYGTYQAQSTCSSTAKPGVQNAKALLNSTYGTRTIGIVRNCSAGGTSEHKEGRALDWMISVRNSSQKATADSFISWLLATDRFGNKHAMARRMGVMYIIWNNKMWRAYDPGRGWAEYQGCSSKTSTGNDTTCHRDHVHLSFTWAGANAKTSFYTGSVPFRVSADLDRSTARVGDTVEISGSVSPVVGAVGKRVTVKRVTSAGEQTVGTPVVDSSGGFSMPYTITSGGTFTFHVYKSGESCSGGTCAYGPATSPKVTVTVVGDVPFDIALKGTPTAVPDGWPVTFTGRIGPANVVAGKTVSFKRYDPATGGDIYLQPVKVNSDGTFAVDYVPTSTGTHQYFVYKAGEQCDADGCKYLGTVSSKTTVKVSDSLPYTVSAKPTVTSVPVGGRVKVAGTVAPAWAAPGTNVIIRDVTTSKAFDMVQTKVNAASGFAATITPKVVGQRKYRAFKPADDCVGTKCDFTSAASGVFTVNVLAIRKYNVTPSRTLFTLPGRTLPVTAIFTPTAPLKGVKLALQERKNGTWVKIGTRVPDAQGRVELRTAYSALGTRYFRFLAPPTSCESGVCLYAGRASGVATVRVVKPDSQRFTISSKASASTITLGKPVVVSGRITPSIQFVGQTVGLRVLKGGTWVQVKNARIGTNGTFAFSIAPNAKGKVTYRVEKGRSGCSSAGCIWRSGVGSSMAVTVR
jgi:hypothetical protein